MAVHNPLSHRLRRRQLPRKGGAYWRSPFVGAADEIVQADIEKVGQFDEGQTGDIYISVFHFLVIPISTAKKISHFFLL